MVCVCVCVCVCVRLSITFIGRSILRLSSLAQVALAAQLGCERGKHVFFRLNSFLTMLSSSVYIANSSTVCLSMTLLIICMYIYIHVYVYVLDTVRHA